MKARKRKGKQTFKASVKVGKARRQEIAQVCCCQALAARIACLTCNPGRNGVSQLLGSYLEALVDGSAVDAGVRSGCGLANTTSCTCAMVMQYIKRDAPALNSPTVLAHALSVASYSTQCGVGDAQHHLAAHEPLQALAASVMAPLCAAVLQAPRYPMPMRDSIFAAVAVAVRAGGNATASQVPKLAAAVLPLVYDAGEGGDSVSALLAVQELGHVALTADTAGGSSTELADAMGAMLDAVHDVIEAAVAEVGQPGQPAEPWVTPAPASEAVSGDASAGATGGASGEGAGASGGDGQATAGAGGAGAGELSTPGGAGDGASAAAHLAPGGDGSDEDTGADSEGEGGTCCVRGVCGTACASVTRRRTPSGGCASRRRCGSDGSVARMVWCRPRHCGKHSCSHHHQVRPRCVGQRSPCSVFRGGCCGPDG